MATKQKGFTLFEILVALVLITGLTLLASSAMAPWFAFKQKLDTDRKMGDMRNALMSAYRQSLMTAESHTDAQLDFGLGAPLVASTVNAEGSCESQAAGLAQLGAMLPESPSLAALDGYSQPWCVLITPQLTSLREGVQLTYHVLALISMGRDGKLDAGTQLNPATGLLTTGGDDVGITVSGFSLVQDAFNVTRARMDKIAGLYGAYFTTQFIANVNRDPTQYYFVSACQGAGDSQCIPATNGNWGTVEAILGNLGVGGQEALSAFESDNAIEVGNHTEQLGTVRVQSPATRGFTPPYTALLRAKLPGPANNYILKVVPGNY